MKKVFKKTLIVCIIVLLIPFVITLLFTQKEKLKSIQTINFTIVNEENGSKDTLSFENYLIGVVAANMPAGYQPEALKAQAVIARTYALYNMAMLSDGKPDKKDFTTSELGLSYISLDSLKKFWGNDYKNYFTKIEDALVATKDQVLVYDDKLILPVFFDTGCGFTRNASEVWGVDVPYLVSTPSKQDVTSTHYLQIVEYDVSDLLSILNKYYTKISLSQTDFFKQIKITSRDSAGYVLKMVLNGQTVTGEEFAKVVGLPSSHFYIEEYDKKARIICNGSGHGIGLSQYGANAMAEEGSLYKQILSYYYTGVKLASVTKEE